MAYLSDQYAAATTDSARNQYLAAGEALSALFNGTMWMLSQFLIAISSTIDALLMLRTSAFAKATAYVGLGIAVFGYGFWIPVIGPILSLLGTVLGIVWYVLMARDFYRLGWTRPESKEGQADALALF
jgi:CHASE2 domain-containing sensor protein